MFRCEVCHKEIQTDSIASGKCTYCRMRAELALWASTPKQARRIMQMSNAQIMVAMKKATATFTTIINSSMDTYNAILEVMLKIAKLLRQAYREVLKHEEFAKIAKKYKIKEDEYEDLRSTAVRKNRVTVTGSQKSKGDEGGKTKHNGA